MSTPEPTERSEIFQPGQSFGKFYLVQVCGEGGSSRIFKALQQPISRLVALKIPTFAAAGGILTPDEFLAEATLMARLDHPNVARIHDFGVEAGKAFICMEYVEGWNLQEVLARRHPLPTSAVLSIGVQVLEGLLHAHSRDVLHQDLSPANVLISRSGTAKLIDFGMAGKSAGGKGGNVVGTPAFLSPEHVAGEPATARSDLFCFGSLLYFACRGEPLFDPGEGNARLAEAFREIGKARWQPPLDRLRALPATLSRLVRSALEGGDAESVLRDLREAWSQAEGTARPEEALRRELAEPRDGDALPASDKEIRETYLRLRSEGRHREAVALLERALRKHPDNPVLRDLLATPPVRAKSAPVTMEVEAPSGGPGRTADRGAPTSSHGPGAGKLRRRALAAIAAGLILATGLATWLELGPLGSQTAPAANPAVASAISAVPDPVPASDRAEIREIPESPKTPAAPPEAAGDSRGGMLKVSAVLPSRPAPPATRLARRSKSPALSVSAPRGTRVLVNDTLELTAPAPKGGWPLPAGLVNLVVTLPGQAPSLSSSLFVAADTLYVLDLEDGGGFSVSRRGR